MRRLAFSLLLSLLAVPMFGQASRDCQNATFISCGDLAQFDAVDNLTVGCYATIDTIAAADYLITKTGSSITAWELAITAAGAVRFTLRDGTPTNHTATGAVLSTGVWYSLVGTWDRSLSSARVKVWVNGVESANAAGANVASAAATSAVGICGRSGGNFWDGKVAHCFAEARTWSAQEIADYHAGNLAQAQRAAGGTGGYLPLWDNAASPSPYLGMGLLAGVCTTATHPPASSDGPRAFIPGGGQ